MHELLFQFCGWAAVKRLDIWHIRQGFYVSSECVGGSGFIPSTVGKVGESGVDGNLCLIYCL